MNWKSTLSAVVGASSLAFAQYPSQTQTGKLLASDGASSARFGSSVDMNGQKAVVGAPDASGASNSSGAAYIMIPSTGAEIAKLQASDGAFWDDFGHAVGIQGDLAIIGAPGDDDNGNNSGSAYLFDASTGAQTRKLLPIVGASNDLFGFAVATDGPLVFVGAPQFGSDHGAVYIFGAALGVQSGMLVGATPDGRFGSSLAVDGNRIVVGARGTLNVTQPGVVHVYDYSLQLIHTLTALDADSSDFFGSSIAISGDVALVGASGDNNANGFDAGAAYLFDLNTGLQTAKLLPCGGTSSDYFGTSVAISGSVAIVTAPRANNLPPSFQPSGAVYYFDIASGAELANLVPTDAGALDNFGVSVAADNGQVLVGTPDQDDNGSDSGALYVFDATPISNSGYAFCFGDGTGTQCPCGNGNNGQGCQNSSGAGGARLTGLGNASLTNDSFHLSVQGVPGNKPGLIIRGSNQLASGLGSVVGDGLLCTTSNTARSHIQVTSAGATDFTNFQGSPFSAWTFGACTVTNYQFWYRDAANTCSGSGFNFTNAWAAYWLP